MTREKLPGPQVKHLLANLSDHGMQHLAEIETDLVQTNVLLAEAIQKLGASFMAIHEAVSAQRQIADVLLGAGTAAGPEMAAQIAARQQEVSEHINAAITGLQFQDMTSQLIGRMMQRVNGLREMLGAVGAGSAGIPEQGTDEIAAALAGINRALESQSVKLESTLCKSVSQTHMESGDIELF